MKVLIIEDEEHAASHLINLLRVIEPDVEVTGVIDNTEEAAEFLETQPPADLIFLDIHLSDGLSFTIFDHIRVDFPVIFTTAYDEYAIRAFELNSVDYLLKPVNKERLQTAVGKYRRLEQRNGREINKQLLGRLTELMKEGRNYRQSFLVPFRDRLLPVPTVDFAWFELSNGVVRGMKFDSKMLTMEERSLDELSEVLDPKLFYRANRQVLVNREAIREIAYFFNGRLYLKVVPSPEEKILISRAKAAIFREWMSG